MTSSPLTTGPLSTDTLSTDTLSTDPLSADLGARTHGVTRVLAAMHLRQAGPAAAAARAERVQRRNQARADRALRLAVARFGAYPAGRAATTLHHGGWGA